MKNTQRTASRLLLVGAVTAFLAFAATASAVNVINLTGHWQDDLGNFIEIERNGPDAVAIMLSPQGRKNWMRGTLDLSGKDILLQKRRGTRTVGTVRGDFIGGIGNPKIRWNSGRVWKKCSRRQYEESLHDHGPDPSHGPVAAELAHLAGRWQTTDQTIVQVVQDGHSVRVNVVSRQGRNHPHHPWTSGHGRISDTSRLSMDCYSGTALTERVTGVYAAGSRGQARITWSNGKTWQKQNENFRVITEPVAAVGRVPIRVIGTVIPTRATSTWQDDHGGYFQRGGDGRWSEYSSRGEIQHRYHETHRTDIAVTLFDDRRRISVHLQKDGCWFRQRSTDDWRHLSDGHWSSGPPNSNYRKPTGRRGHHPGYHGHAQDDPPSRDNGGSKPRGLLQSLFGN